MFQHKGWGVRFLAIAAVLAVGFPGAPMAAKQGEGRAAGPVRPPYAVTRATSPIQVDGRLDEAAWQGAAVIDLAFPDLEVGAAGFTAAGSALEDGASDLP